MKLKKEKELNSITETGIINYPNICISFTIQIFVQIYHFYT